MRILVLSDLHAPFMHPDATDFLSDLKRQYRPHEVVCIGDEIDAHGWSRHQREPDAPGQADELAQAKEMLKDVFKLFPMVRVCRSNHGERAYKAATRIGLPSIFIRDMHEVLGAPTGWKWAEGHYMDGIVFQHGDGFSGQNAALKAATVNRRSTVIGHIHAWAGVQYHANQFGTIWGMNVGCLVDPKSIAMSYAKSSPNKAVLGAGLVLDGMPLFVPMETDE